MIEHEIQDPRGEEGLWMQDFGHYKDSGFPLGLNPCTTIHQRS